MKLAAWSNRILLASAVAVTFGYFVVFSLSPSNNGEDLAFARIWHGESPWQKLPWLATRWSDQIAGWNARLGEQLSIFWLNMPPVAYNIAATLAFLAITYFSSQVFRSETGGRVQNWATMVVFCFALWPSMDIFFWRTSQAGYLQPMILYFWLLSRVSKPVYQSLSPSLGKIVTYSVIGFLAGISFENTPPVLAAVMIGFLFKPLFRLKFWRWFAPIVSLLAGWAVLILMPSTQFRINFFKKAFHFQGYTLDYILQRALNVAGTFVVSSWILALIFVAACVWLLAFNRSNSRFVTVSLAGVLLNCMVLIAAPYTEPRVFTFSWLLMLGLIIYVLRTLLQSSTTVLVATSLASIVSLVTVAYLVPTYANFSNQMNNRDAMIQSEHGSEACKVGLPISPVHTDAATRFLNNREVWVFSSLDQVSNHYDCKVVSKN